jgi:hypothetical protein
MPNHFLLFCSEIRKSGLILILVVCFLAACACIDARQPVQISPASTPVPPIATTPLFITGDSGSLPTSLPGSPITTLTDAPNILDQNPESPVTEQKWIAIDTVGRHALGDVIPLYGLTNIDPGDILLVSVYPASVDDAHEPQEFVSGYYVVKQIPVSGNNSTPFPWYTELDTKQLIPDEYIVKVQGVVHSATATQRFRLYGDALNMDADQSVVIREGTFWTNNLWSITVPEIESQIPLAKAKIWVVYNESRLGGLYVTPGYSDLWYSAIPHDENTPRLGIIVSDIGTDMNGEYIRGAVSWNTSLNTPLKIG